MSDSLFGGIHAWVYSQAKNVSTGASHLLTNHWSRLFHSLRSMKAKNLLLWYKVLVYKGCVRRDLKSMPAITQLLLTLRNARPHLPGAFPRPQVTSAR